MMTPRNPSRGRRAFSLMEVLMAAALAVVFSFIVVQTMTSMTTLTSDIVKEARVETSASQLLDRASRAIRNARPHGTCDDSRFTSMTTCARPIDEGAAFLLASPTRMVFFSYATKDTSSTLQAPDLVELTVTRTVTGSSAGVDPISLDTGLALCLKVQPAPANQDFVSAWRGFTLADANTSLANTAQTCIGGLRPDPVTGTQDMFSYLDSSGTSTTTPAAIANVRVQPTFSIKLSASTGSTSQIKTYDQYVSVNYAVLGGLA